MKLIAFREPNFRCRVSKKGDPKKFWRLCYAEDASKAQEFLESKGLVVHLVESYDFSKDWLKRAKEETKKAIAARQAGLEWDFKAIWSDLKDHLLDLLNGKCAYCEADFRHVAYGDVEHYRPKAKVAEEEDHPGYYWLAYDPHNYLPSCQLCNQYAKKTHFPISESGVRAYKPDDPLEDEEALLLNPSINICSEHIEYVPSRKSEDPSYARGTSEEGRKTIEVMKLNRQELVNMRVQKQKYVRMEIKQSLVNEDPDALNRILSEVVSGECSFFSAAFCEINDYYTNMGLSSPFI